MTTSLFIESNLRYTTSFAGSAYAEAFVHPALISHPNPLRVAVISMAPLALLQEILKHKKVETVVIFTSKKILNFSLECFAHLNDCDDIEGYGAKCLDSERVLVVDMEECDSSLEEFESNDGIHIQELYYDAVFMDSETLSYENMKNVFDMVDYVPDSIVVVSQGSAPSLDAIINEDID